MGHGCHDCGCPNGCECPGTHGDWYNQRYELKTTTLDFDQWQQEYRSHNHIMTIAAVAAALPVNREADALVAKALRRASGETTNRKLISIKDITERVRLIRLSLHAEDVERATVMLDDLAFRLGIS